MKKIFPLVAVLLISCSGDEAMTIRLREPLPEALEAHASSLVIKGILREGLAPSDRTLSEPATATSDAEGYRFDLQPIAAFPESGAALIIELGLPADEGSDVVLAALAVEGVKEGAALDIAARELALNVAIDDDEDGLNNIDELRLSLHPRRADTDGDNIPDGLDRFPSLAAEWDDTDRDGLGDNRDDDIDGDGLSNVEEKRFGTDLFKADSDGDGIGDRDDNCRLTGNADQRDGDADGLGDPCDDDADADGLSDSDEVRFGTDRRNPDSDGDGLIDGVELRGGSDPLRADTDRDSISDGVDNCPLRFNSDQRNTDGDAEGDPCDADSDGDGVADASDNCPAVANGGQGDIDGDSTGDTCDADSDGDGIDNVDDNCPLVANPQQLASDSDADGVAVECDLDDADSSVDGGELAYFVDGAHGADSNAGSRDAPFATIAHAALHAVPAGRHIYVAAGTYDVSALVVRSGLKLFGGFRNSQTAAIRFSARLPHDRRDEYQARLIRSDAAPTLSLVDADRVVLNGFTIENGAVGASSATVSIDGGAPLLEKNDIVGNRQAAATTALAVRRTQATVRRNLIDGGPHGASSARATAVMVQGQAQPLFENNIIRSGVRRFVTGVAIEASSPRFISNTIEVLSADANLGTAEGIVLIDAEVSLINNFIVTGNAGDQFPLYCVRGGAMSASSFAHNAIAALNISSNTLVRTCDGLATNSSGFPMGNAAVQNNEMNTAAQQPADLFDGNFNPVNFGVDRGSTAAGIPGVDYYGRSRPRGGAHDIGAVER